MVVGGFLAALAVISMTFLSLSFIFSVIESTTIFAMAALGPSLTVAFCIALLTDNRFSRLVEIIGSELTFGK